MKRYYVIWTGSMVGVTAKINDFNETAASFEGEPMRVDLVTVIKERGRPSSDGYEAVVLCTEDTWAAFLKMNPRTTVLS